MRYLITGIAGFVGSSLARAIIAREPDAEITGIDDLSYGYPERLEEIIDGIEFIKGDVININELLGRRQFSSIIHCAAIAPLPECQINSYRAITQNVAVCGSVADYALQSGSTNIVFLSSGAVYEGSTNFPSEESSDLKNSLIYPITKLMAENYFETMCRSHELNVVAIRLFNLYGPHQDYFRKQPPLIGYLLSCLVRNETAVLYSTGEQSRDYIYIDDLLDLVMVSLKKMTERSRSGYFKVVNAGSGVSTSVNSIISQLEQISCQTLNVERRPSAQYWNKYAELFQRAIPLSRSAIEKEVEKHTQAATESAYREFEWATKIKLKTGLELCFHHAKKIL